MSSMFFGQYLLEKGVINRDALLDAIERQRKANRTLVELAVDQGLLNFKTAEALTLIFRVSNRPLEDICINEGGLPADTVNELIAYQKANRLLIGDALIAGGHLTSKQVETSLVSFLKQETREKQTLEADFDHLPETEIVRVCTELTLRHVSRVADVPVKLSDIAEGTGGLARGHVRFGQAIVGDKRLCITIDLQEGLLARVAAGMLGSTTSVGPGEADDAASELVNIIGGNACTHLEVLGFKLRPEPPFSARDETPAGAYRTAIRARAMAGDDQFELNLFVG